MSQHDGPAITFGKYRGACAQCVADNDPQYAEWCLAQVGLEERYPEACGYWRSLGIVPPRKCARVTQAGDPCTNNAKIGHLCGMHYRATEKSALPALAEEIESAFAGMQD